MDCTQRAVLTQGCVKNVRKWKTVTAVTDENVTKRDLLMNVSNSFIITPFVFKLCCCNMFYFMLFLPGYHKIIVCLKTLKALCISMLIARYQQLLPPCNSPEYWNRQA